MWPNLSPDFNLQNSIMLFFVISKFLFWTIFSDMFIVCYGNWFHVLNRRKRVAKTLSPKFAKQKKIIKKKFSIWFSHLFYRLIWQFWDIIRNPVFFLLFWNFFQKKKVSFLFRKYQKEEITNNWRTVNFRLFKIPSSFGAK